MAYISIYRGDAHNLALSFTNPDGSPMNMSGSSVFLAAAQNYSTPPILYVGTTGNDSASVTGLINLAIASGDTNVCAQVYQAVVRVLSPSGSPTTYPTDGLSILPNILPLPSP